MLYLQPGRDWVLIKRPHDDGDPWSSTENVVRIRKDRICVLAGALKYCTRPTGATYQSVSDLYAGADIERPVDWLDFERADHELVSPSKSPLCWRVPAHKPVVGVEDPL